MGPIICYIPRFLFLVQSLPRRLRDMLLVGFEKTAYISDSAPNTEYGISNEGL
jgi:hypothetical protein